MSRKTDDQREFFGDLEGLDLEGSTPCFDEVPEPELEPERELEPEAEVVEGQGKKARKPRKKGERNKELGSRGEEAAARFLVRRGYDIIERNWKCYAGEADIIARDEDTLIFVEVKTRKDCQKGFPAEAVSNEKRAKYEKIALSFLADYDAIDLTVRFDVISIVVVAEDRALIRHHIAAFSGM